MTLKLSSQSFDTVIDSDVFFCTIEHTSVGFSRLSCSCNCTRVCPMRQPRPSLTPSYWLTKRPFLILIGRVAMNNFCLESEFWMSESLLLVAASYRYAIDASRREHSIELELSLIFVLCHCTPARATDFCHMTSPWQHIVSMRIIWQNGASDTPNH
jgi:hypothetical protein